MNEPRIQTLQGGGDRNQIKRNKMSDVLTQKKLENKFDVKELDNRRSRWATLTWH
jgi:hypothetical protein